LSKLPLIPSGEPIPEGDPPFAAVFWNTPSDGCALEMLEIGGVRVSQNKAEI